MPISESEKKFLEAKAEHYFDAREFLLKTIDESIESGKLNLKLGKLSGITQKKSLLN
ncbi:MAG: hypothetical protein ABIA76_03770 [Candidatus Diapherotrites archaeon]